MPPKIEVLREFVKVKALNARQADMIGGEDLRKIEALLGKIPDHDLRMRIRGELQQQPKYPALNLLLNPNHPLMQHYQELGKLMVYSGCDMDFTAEQMKPPV